MSNDAIVTAWSKVKTLVESMDIDIQKNAGGNASAGVRARRGLRLLKKEAAALIKSMVEVEKSRKAAE
jgi:urease gamma subunit